MTQWASSSNQVLYHQALYQQFSNITSDWPMFNNEKLVEGISIYKTNWPYHSKRHAVVISFAVTSNMTEHADEAKSEMSIYPSQWLANSQRESALSLERASYLNVDILLGLYMKTVHMQLNSLRPSDAIWRQTYRSTLVQVMVCCLTAPSHYPNQCWLFFRKVQWHASEGCFTFDISTNIY